MVSARCREAMQKIAVVQPSLTGRQSPPCPAIAREAHGAAPACSKRGARCGLRKTCVAVCSCDSGQALVLANLPWTQWPDASIEKARAYDGGCGDVA